MPDNHYENRKLAELYDSGCPWNIERQFYFSLAKIAPQTILDLGCGTGLICRAFAEQHHDVTGVDPSLAMIEVGQEKPHGLNVNWVQDFAQSYVSDKLFDLVIMTGNAFQVLLEDKDILETFSNMKRQLKPDGIIAFETRNPVIDWKKNWNTVSNQKLPGGTVHISRRLLSMENNRMIFEHKYNFPDEVLTSTSELRFTSAKEIQNFVIDSKLQVHKLLGDWNGELFNEKSSLEMVFILNHS